MADFKLVTLKKEDCNDLVNFLNTVFSLYNKKQMHFERDIQRIFKESDETMSFHVAAKTGGKIIGCAGTYPIFYKVGGNELRIGSVESVAVDPEYRNMGIMQAMMAKMEEDNINKYDMCYLLGDRMRYSHFGFDRCGTSCVFNIKMSMLGKDAPKKNYTFEAVKDKNDMLLKRIYDFYITQEVCRIREFDVFYDSMTTYGHMIYAVIDENGEVCGYFIIDSSFSDINEIALKNEGMFQDVFKCLMLLKKISILYVSMPIYHMLFEKASEFCDRYQLYQPGCYKINNFKKVAESYMREKSKYQELVEGTLTIDSEVFGKWKITKEKDTISVEKFEGETEIILSERQSYQALFGTFGEKCRYKDKKVACLMNSWFPLPLYSPPML